MSYKPGDVTVTNGSGNVFADLELDDAIILRKVRYCRRYTGIT